MPLTINTTLIGEDSTHRPGTIVSVSGAFTPPANTYLNAPPGAGYDGWLALAPATITNSTSKVGVVGASAVALAAGTIYREFTGLGAFAQARFTVTMQLVTAGAEVAISMFDVPKGVAIAKTRFQTAPGYLGNVSLELATTIPASGKVRLEISVRNPVTAALNPNARIIYARLRVGTWAGTRLRRTDANGAQVPVRMAPQQDVDGSGAMTVVDYEADLSGQPVTYTVLDGFSNTQSTTTSQRAGYLYLTEVTKLTPDLPAAPQPAWARALTATQWSETTQAQILSIDRLGTGVDFDSSAGMGLRDLSITVLCADYKSARQLVQHCAASGIMLLSQPDYLGADSYVIARTATQVAALPGGSKWVVNLSLIEVAKP